ncbi:glutathionyl-hydroquinone reductase YqjG [Arsukibacterium ikkense]|uniref:Glutathionyl-hydroquinone reductase YqjG n=1 Tax=Arsukibacterium ikkense TaxID=336831 RepID=A0A0M2V5D4_9GAMM|nr:glutathione S-transferase family protein [Arsukibacterium ikkense]KKO45836.1 glutathionyl-hydroquinone reductase YqjG [Arsukibacterium ikkense]
MGLLVNGNWQDKWYDTDSTDGEFKRENAQLRNWVTPDGSAGLTGKAGFKAEKDRYHLYVSLACPWAHRTLIFLQLKNLTDHISVSVVSPDMLQYGWEFAKNNHSSGDNLFNYDYLYQVYTRHQADYSGRVTVPVLWDKQQNCIVSNESADIIRMLNCAFNSLTGNNDDYYPSDLQEPINEINELVYSNINNGVYLCGFATRQQAYETAYQKLFAALDQVEAKLSHNRYLTGERLTEADWRLFTTLIRFDAVYHGHFKCNKQRLADYPNLAGFTRELYQWPGVAATVDFYHIKRHYYYSHTMINPSQVVPAGPDINYLAPHQRQNMLSAAE